MSKLREGDVFDLTEGHTVYMDLPAHFVYGNRQGVFDEIVQGEVVVGPPHNGMLTDWLAGEYVVTGTGLHDNGDDDDGHYVQAEKLPDPTDNLADDSGPRVKVSFYQDGGFTAENSDIVAKGRARAHWTVER
jgi:hypothetical protein